tara:strand:+ start:2015 stop:3691 length:1677 start_codon:yes stop_codon:yes gene_type:complete
MHHYINLKKILELKGLNSLILLLVISIIVACLELIGIGIVVPVVQLLMGLEIFFAREQVVVLKNFFGIDNNKFIILFFSTILFFFTFKTFFQYISIYLRQKLLMELRLYYSNYLLKYYLESNIENIINTSSSIFIRNIHQEVTKFLQGYLFQVIILVAETILVFFIFLFLLYFNPIITVITSIFFILAGYIIFLNSKRSLKIWSKKRIKYDAKVINILQNIFYSFREIKIYKIDHYLSKEFDIKNQISSKAQFKHGLISSIPRIILELLSVTIIILIILFSITLENNEDLLIQMGVFAASIVRLIPSISKIVSSIQHIKFHRPSIEIFFKKNKLVLNQSNKKIDNIKKKNFTRSIKIKNYYFKYNNSDNHILNNFNLTIAKNDIIGIVGESGSGKSTIVSLIAGLLDSNKGQIKIDGIDIKNIKEWWLTKISYVPQKVTLVSNSFIKNIILNNKDFNKKRLKKILDNLNLEKFIKRNSQINLSNISGGELQRIGIARALYKESEILILDEVTSSLDKNNEKNILNIIRELKGKKTIILTTHNQRMLKYCNKILKLTKK